jgi:hypothetical protein
MAGMHSCPRSTRQLPSAESATTESATTERAKPLRKAGRTRLSGVLLVVATLAAALAGCASGPPTPDWQADAHGAMQRATRADLEGLDRLAAMEWARAEAAVTRTARADLLARVALTRCAIAQARLQWTPCVGFDRYTDAATLQDHAYRAYLNAALPPDAVNALPEAHRAVALSLQTAVDGQALPRGASDRAVASPSVLLQGMADPVSRLVAGSVLWRAQRLDAEALQVLVDTASHQGWQGALMAWLVAQRSAAEQAGQPAVAQAAQRRIELLSANAPARPAPKAD